MKKINELEEFIQSWYLQHYLDMIYEELMENEKKTSL